MRRLFDSLEILSTLGRRLDVYVMARRMQAVDAPELWNLLFVMADRALIDKARIFRRLQTIEDEDSEFAQELASRLRQAEREDSSGVEYVIERCLLALSDPDDRRTLSLWLNGETLHSIAELVDSSPEATRKRWARVKAALRIFLTSTPH